MGLKEEIVKAREITDRLFSSIDPQARYDRPIPERHRMIFYLGHLEAFDWNQAAESLSLKSKNKEFDRLFAFGIDPPVGQPRTDTISDWPAFDEINAYNHSVRDGLDRRILSELPDDILGIMLEHRLMHAETFAYILHNLPFDRKSLSETPRCPETPPVTHRMISIPSGTVRMGLDKAAQFGWDNEFQAIDVDVPEFRIEKYKVTNEDYLKFVQAGAQPPHFWIKRPEGWFYRAMNAEIPLPMSWPVYVTHDEAAAFANWMGKALPTEAQFSRAAYGAPSGGERLYPWGNEAPDSTRGNFGFARWDPVPVNAFPKGDSAFGVSQMVGNGWEWTSTRFHPFAGFTPFKTYPGYSKPFFDNQHYVLKGGSPRTAPRLLRRSFRNWFRPNYPYLYATFRLADNL